MTATPQDLYALLKLPRTATHAQIRAAYRSAAKTHHPDAGGDPATFAALNLANTVLQDPARRAQYDATGSIDHTSIEQERAALMEIIAGATQATVLNAQMDPGTFDFLAALRAHVQSRITEGDKVLTQHAAALAKFDSVLARCKSKKKPADPALPAILANQRKQIAEAEAKDQATVARFKKALGLLKDYSYEFAAPRAPGGYQHPQSDFGGTTFSNFWKP